MWEVVVLVLHATKPSSPINKLIIKTMAIVVVLVVGTIAIIMLHLHITNTILQAERTGFTTSLRNNKPSLHLHNKINNGTTNSYNNKISLHKLISIKISIILGTHNSILDRPNSSNI